MFNDHHERVALFLFWVQLVGVTGLVGIYFISWVVFFSLLGLVTIFAYYAFNTFMPSGYLPHILTFMWVFATSLYGVSIAFYLDGTLVPIILIIVVGMLSYVLNNIAGKLWMGRLS